MQTLQILQQLFASDHETFVTRLFKEFLNRDPTPQTLAYFTRCLKSGMKSKNEIFKIVIMSTEFNELIKKESYQSLLQLFQGLIRSDAETFVTEIYRKFLGRDPDLDAFQHFIHLLKTGTSKIDILRTVLLSEEAFIKFHAQSDLISKDTSSSMHYSTIWPHISISTRFRENVKKILSAHYFPYTTNILVKTGGLGDFVQITPVAKALKTKEPLRPVVVIVGQYGSLFDEHPYIDLTIECGPMNWYKAVKSVVGLVENVFDLRYISRAYGTWKNSNYFYKNIWYYENFPHSGIHIDSLNKHVCDLMLFSLGLEKYANCNDVYIKPDMMIEKIPGDYVVVNDSPGCRLEELKRWTKDGWNKLIKWLHMQGIIPVQLGLVTDSLIHPTVMDLRGKTSLRQAAAYLKLSKCYIGIEGGLFHLAKAVGTPAVVIFNTTSETCFAYPDTHVVTKKLCNPCWLNESWLKAKCLKGNKSCLNLPDWESVAAKVSNILKKDNRQNK
ncbi:DUF4214 domain-containing protein [Crassaminicella thermophila]|uniref:DUF4214 domain-containing protein n=1 Tax=Crassaminicella thermophila TaxID=2599308 RepID=A0A5C0SEL9_CRATE|nr:DUF4214 domain-containing protein [Crassaminicella thermophila]QEK12883.1 DUF4214 domain-containing protein [Crassaminicella thermophila]